MGFWNSLGSGLVKTFGGAVKGFLNSGFSGALTGAVGGAAESILGTDNPEVSNIVQNYQQNGFQGLIQSAAPTINNYINDNAQRLNTYIPGLGEVAGNYANQNINQALGFAANAVGQVENNSSINAMTQRLMALQNPIQNYTPQNLQMYEPAAKRLQMLPFNQ